MGERLPHPMHLHGFRCRVLGRKYSPGQVAGTAVDEQGRMVTDLGWKDTVLVWPGETVRIAIQFSQRIAMILTHTRHACASG